MRGLLVGLLAILITAMNRGAARWNAARKKRLEAFQKAWDDHGGEHHDG